jgi:hypothetical protein
MMMLILDKMMMLTNHAMRSLSCATLVVAGAYIVISYLSASLLLTQNGVVGIENRFDNGPTISTS